MGEDQVMSDSKKKTFLKTLSWETFHLVGVAGVIYLFTGEWEYATWGALLYIAWEATGYFVHERLWTKFGKKVE
jgi:uncharacterized membrane protein